jgi:hypothetical protein
MPLNVNAFQKCAPALSTNVKQCGTVTLCNAKPLTADEMTSVYMKSTDYRVMEALFHHDTEIRQCEAVQNGLYDFFMANKVAVNKNFQTKRKTSGLMEIAPFILARQFSPINNAYWKVSAGATSGGNWAVTVTSSTNIPFDCRSFPAGMRVYISGKSAGGSATHTAWKVVSCTDNGDSTGSLVLSAQNSGSFLDSDKLGNPVTGLLMRGTPNVSDYEKFCAEQPGYMNWKDIPFFFETKRTSMCRSSLYNKWRKLLLEDNPLYREYGDLDDIQKNKQLAADWMRRVVDDMFWGKPLPYQNTSQYDQLDDITSFDGSAFGLGVDGGKCVGKRANASGIYEQMGECGRIVDLQNGQLNLPALFKALYNMMRVKEGAQNKNPRSFDLFTDSAFGELFNQAMIKYYNAKSDNTLRLSKDVDGPMKKAEFGFNFRSYALFWPPGVTINIVTHFFFDDYLSASADVGQEEQGRMLWILDFTGIYPGVISSKKKTWKTGELSNLAALSPDFACVLEVNTQEQSLMSLTMTVIVECPMANLIIEGIANTLPEPTTSAGVYPPTGTTTTTTTPTPYTG